MPSPMCGIYFSLSRAEASRVEISPTLLQFLKERGPDACQDYAAIVKAHDGREYHLNFLSTVLALRGNTVVPQPLRDDASGCVLCWNGEAWSRHFKPLIGNDSIQVFDALVDAARRSAASSSQIAITCIATALTSFQGPFAFVFYDAFHKLLFYGRDQLGRRSLILEDNSEHRIVLSSLSDPNGERSSTEVEATGIYVLHFSDEADELSVHKNSKMPGIHTQYVQYNVDQLQSSTTSSCLYVPLSLNMKLPNFAYQAKEISPASVAELNEALRSSLSVRCLDIRTKSTLNSNMHSPIAVLFSGGLDCTVLARILHDILPAEMQIELLNVAFENSRIHRNLLAGKEPYELCPDRITAIKSSRELQHRCPTRIWNLVKINIPYSETLAHRQTIIQLMRPHNTEMDLSIASALYFASRGKGLVGEAGSEHDYSSTARVLLSGLGADELFGGYQRHSIAFARGGYQGLLEELDIDIRRLGQRNLGRDDRIMSHWGKEVRFPYLDERLMATVLELPVWEKCEFALTSSEEASGPLPGSLGDKRILRLLAWELGMPSVAIEKKRAIQFGARTAKMETGNVKGTQILSTDVAAGAI